MKLLNLRKNFKNFPFFFLPSRFFLVTLFFLLFFMFSLSVFAARMFFDVKDTELRVGEKFEVKLYLNTEVENINTISGEIIFPKNLLSLKEISDGNSIVNLWLEKPQSEKLVFSGIIPGGYKGRNGLILSMIFEVISEGRGVISVRDAKAFLNDGQGTLTSTNAFDFSFVTVKKPIYDNFLFTSVDLDLPELFIPEIAKDDNIFDGKWFLVFYTQDKGSGIDHYEILEKEQKNSIKGLFLKNNWQVGNSPYLLKDQSLKSRIFVKAVDKAGNERVVEVPPRNLLSWYENYLFWIIIILIVVIISVFKNFFFQRRNFKNKNEK